MENKQMAASTANVQLDDAGISEKLIKKIKGDVLKMKTGKEKRYFTMFVKMLEGDEVPKIRGRIVEATGNDYFGRSWEVGVKISIKGKFIKLQHDADVAYEHVFPHTRWYEKSKVGIKSQLKELISSERLKEDDILVVEFKDYESKTYGRSFKIEIKISELLPFLV